MNMSRSLELRARVLFLDIDGVLHPGNGADGCLMCSAKQLEDALSDHELRIVISSSWRFHMELEEIVERLPAGIADRVVDATGDAHIGRWPRFNEIRNWVVVNDPLVDWRALDDAKLEFPNPCTQLIACDPRTGFAVDQATALRKWLSCRS
jgi:hypothetical protein